MLNLIYCKLDHITFLVNDEKRNALFFEILTILWILDLFRCSKCYYGSHLKSLFRIRQVIQIIAFVYLHVIVCYLKMEPRKITEKHTSSSIGTTKGK